MLASGDAPKIAKIIEIQLKNGLLVTLAGLLLWKDILHFERCVCSSFRWSHLNCFCQCNAFHVYMWQFWQLGALVLLGCLKILHQGLGLIAKTFDWPSCKKTERRRDILHLTGCSPQPFSTAECRCSTTVPAPAAALMRWSHLNCFCQRDASHVYVWQFWQRESRFSVEAILLSVCSSAIPPT